MGDGSDSHVDSLVWVENRMVSEIVSESIAFGQWNFLFISPSFVRMIPMEGDLIGVFALLVGLELILGVDNALVIAILVARLPEEKRAFSRNLGLGLALVMRIFMVIGGLRLVQLTGTGVGERAGVVSILLA